MEKSKFNPASPEYKKVADLPEPIQGNYSDLSDGGFVRKSALKETEEAKKAAVSKREGEIEEDSLRKIGWIFDKIAGRLESKITKETTEILHDKAREQTPVEAIIENVKNIIREQVYVEMYQEMQEKLKEMGKTGHIFLTGEEWRTCENMHGEIDGLKIRAHFCCDEGENSAFVDGRWVNKSIMNQIIEKYLPVALDRRKLEIITDRIIKEVTEDIKSRYAGNDEMTKSKLLIKYYKDMDGKDIWINKSQDEFDKVVKKIL